MGIFRRLVRGKREAAEKGHQIGDELRQNAGTLPAPQYTENFKENLDNEEMERAEDSTGVDGMAARSLPGDILPYEHGDARGTEMQRRAGMEGIHDELEVSEDLIREMVALAKVLAESSGPLLIGLGELRLLLAEAGLDLIRAEAVSEEKGRAWDQLDERLALAEEKCREIEHMLVADGKRAGAPAPSLMKARLLLGRLKIALANARIELIRMVSGDAGGIPVETVQQPEGSATAVEREESRSGTKPADSNCRTEGRVHIAAADATTTLLIPPARPRIDGGARQESNEPKHDPIILGPLTEELPPLDAGIGGERVKIRETEREDAGMPPAMETTRVRVRGSGDTPGTPPVSDRKVVIPEQVGRDAVAEPRGEEREISVRVTGVEQILLVDDLNRRGIELRKAGRAEEAITFFDRVLEMDPSNLAAYHNRGVALRTLGRYGEALTNFERVLQSEPENRIALFNKAFVLCRMNRLEEGVATFDRLLALDPSNAAAWFSRGKALLLLGREGEGNESIQRARELGFREGGEGGA